MFKRRQKNAKRNWSIGNDLQSSAIKRHFGTRRCLILECLPRWHCSPMFHCARLGGGQGKWGKRNMLHFSKLMFRP